MYVLQLIVEQMPTGRVVESSQVRAVHESMHVCLSRPAAKARRSYDVVAVSKQDYKEGHRLLDQTPNSVFGLLRQMLVSQSMRIYLLVV